MKYLTLASALVAAGAVSAQSDTITPPAPSPTACPAAGETDAAGDYGCNPNRDYPGQACALLGDCYILEGLGVIVPTATSSGAPTPSPTKCPAAGETNVAGQYGCNPNRDYPDHACALLGDCYILEGLGGVVTTANSVNPTNPTKHVVKPTSVVPAHSTMTTVIHGVTTAVPVPHSSAVHGGIVTTGGDGVGTTLPPPATPTTAANGGIVTTGDDGAVTTLPPGAVPTAGAGQLGAAGGAAAALAFAAALL